MFKAMDLFMERQVADRSCDSGATRALSREVNDLYRSMEHDRRQTLTMKDKVALTSVSMLLGSPLLLLGLGGTFALCDDMDFRRQSRELKDFKDGAGKFGLRKGATDAQSNALRRLNAPLAVTLMSLDVQATRSPARRSGMRQADRLPVTGDKRQRRLTASSNWLEANKLIKRKQFLTDEVERVNKGNQLGVVANLLSQIERLDKALKRMGC